MGDFGEILKHSRNYLIASLATKALAFISIPVYTRLLTTNDYGVVSIFLSVVGLLNSLFTLGCDCAISRYYFEKKNLSDFRSFVSTSVFLSILIFVINSSLFCLFVDAISLETKLPTGTVYLIIPVVLFNIIGLLFEQIYNPQKKSEIIAKLSLFRVYIGFACSITFILLLDYDKYFGQIGGQIAAGIILCLFWVRKIKPYLRFSFSMSHVRYILLYSLPLIPYSMSGALIEQFGKLSIGSRYSVSDAGYYSLALSISGLVAVIIGVTHQAWNPYYFEYMNNKNYLQHDRDQNRIFRITILGGISLAALGSEIGWVLAKSNFTSSLYLIPVFVVGYIFYQLAYVYMRNFGYARKTIYSTVTVLLSGLVNISLNMYAIPHWGELGAAMSFVSSYIFMAFMSWCLNKYVLKFHTTQLKIFLIPLSICLPFFAAIFYLKFDSYFFSLTFRILIIVVVAFILFWSERLAVMNKIRSFSNR